MNTANVALRERAAEDSQRAKALPEPPDVPARARPNARFQKSVARPVNRRRPGAVQSAAKSGAQSETAAVAIPLRTRLAAPAGFALAALVIAYGWYGRDLRTISADSGVGYALGILSVCCMATLLIYPLRKRLRFLGFLGSIRNWFRTHQQMGVMAPIAALYHCNFELGSLNSRVALYCALIVAGSGLVGRFLYRRLNRSVTGKRTDLKQVRASLAAERFPENRALPFLPLLRQRIHRFDQSVADAGKGYGSSIRMAFTLPARARRERKVLLRFCAEQLGRESARQPLIARHRHRLHESIDRYLFSHMSRLRLLATLQAYERMFSLWHIVHLPFFVLLLISVVVHILAVHLY